MKKIVKVPLTVEQMAEEVWKRGVGASGPQLSDLVTEVMKSNGNDPQDPLVRGEIGKIFRTLLRRAS